MHSSFHVLGMIFLSIFYRARRNRNVCAVEPGIFTFTGFLFKANSHSWPCSVRLLPYRWTRSRMYCRHSNHSKRGKRIYQIRIFPAGIEVYLALNIKPTKLFCSRVFAVLRAYRPFHSNYLTLLSGIEKRAFLDGPISLIWSHKWPSLAGAVSSNVKL